MPEVTYRILGRDYALCVSEADRPLLDRAAALVAARAESAHAAQRDLTPERVAILAALQIAFDSLAGTLQRPPEDPGEQERIDTLLAACERALSQPPS